MFGSPSQCAYNDARDAYQRRHCARMCGGQPDGEGDINRAEEAGKGEGGRGRSGSERGKRSDSHARTTRLFTPSPCLPVALRCSP